jgi:hypothetical protein
MFPLVVYHTFTDENSITEDVSLYAYQIHDSLQRMSSKKKINKITDTQQGELTE